MHRLAVFEHHIVTDIDEIVDRAQTDRRQPPLHPNRAGADLHTGDDVRSIKRTIFTRLDPHRSQQVRTHGLARIATEFFLRVAELQFEPSRELPRDAEVREAVRTVRRDLDIEHDITGRQHRVDRGAGCRTVFQDKQSARILGHAKLLR